MVSLLKEADWSPELLEHELCEEMAMQLMELPEALPVVAAAAAAIDEALVVARSALSMMGRTGGSRGNSSAQMSFTSGRGHSVLSRGGPPVPPAVAGADMDERRRSVLLFRGPRLKVGIDVGQVCEVVCVCVWGGGG